MQAVRIKNRLSLHSVWDFTFKTSGSLSFGKVDHFQMGQHGSVSFGISTSSHDTISDVQNKGLMKQGRAGCSPYLTLEKWNSPDLKTIEHIAPQTNNEGWWDEELYDPHIETYQTMGNLTLLPQDLNSSAGNKKWGEKLLYYKSVSIKDQEDLINQINNEAAEQNITLNPDTLSLLHNSNFHDHLAPISGLSKDDKWDKALVDKRTDRMLSIIWDTISPWILGED